MLSVSEIKFSTCIQIYPSCLSNLPKDRCFRLSPAFPGFVVLLRRMRLTQDGLQDQGSLHSFPTKLLEGNQTDRWKHSDICETTNHLFPIEREISEQLSLTSCCLYFYSTLVWDKELIFVPLMLFRYGCVIKHDESCWCTFHGDFFLLKIHCCFCFVKKVMLLSQLCHTCWYRLDSSRRKNPAVDTQYKDMTLPFTLIVIVRSRGRLSPPVELCSYAVVFCTLTAWGIHCVLAVTSSKEWKLYLLVLWSTWSNCILSPGTSVVLFYPSSFAHLTALWSWKIALFRLEGAII